MAIDERTKLLTDSGYSPTNATSEGAIRGQVDGSIDEVYDNIKTGIESEVDGDSGMDTVGMTPIDGVMLTPQQSLEYLKIRVDASAPTLNIKSVKDYGLIGDGAADESAAFTVLLDAASNGDVIYFPNGTYLMSTFSEYTLSKDLTFIGQDVEYTIIKGVGQSLINLFKGNSSVRLENITFRDTGYIFNYTGSTLTHNFFKANNCKFTLVASPVYWITPVGAEGFEEFEFKNNIIDTCTRGVFLPVITFKKAVVNENTINTVSKAAVRIGANPLTTIEYVEVCNNKIDGVTDATNANGVQILGDTCLVDGNKISNVASVAETDSEGIYVQCNESIVVNNTLIDAGRAQGCIAFKSNQDTGICVGNVIKATVENVVGIYSSIRELTVLGNIIEGVEDGILIDSTDAPRAYNIHGNTFTNLTGEFAIKSRVEKNIFITDNTIDGVDASTTAATKMYGVLIDTPSDIDTIETLVIKDNIFKNVYNGVDDARSISVVMSNGVSNTVNKMIIEGNTFENTTRSLILQAIDDYNEVRITDNDFVD